ncbi:MAG: hypothetical protein KGZ84_05505 [Erysipelotrichia bacterium]|jgi:hypothetical protein|nr:hypothetical protein [Erysipelotrichia bacterium]
MEVIEKRSCDRSTLFCSKMDIEEWHRRLGSSAMLTRYWIELFQSPINLFLKVNPCDQSLSKQ